MSNLSNLLLAPPSAFDFSAIFGNVVEKWYYYVGALVFVALLVVLLFVSKKRSPRNNLTHTQKIVYTAVLTALCTVVNSFSYFPVSYISISFVPTVCFIAGFLLGAKGGFAVGFIGDLIGAIIFPAGAYNPVIGIANGMLGFIPGFIFEYFKGNKYLLIAISAVVSLIVCTSGLNTLGLWLIYGMGKKTFWVYLLVRLPWQVLVAAGNAFLCSGLAALLPRVLPVGKFNINDDKAEKTQAED